MTFCMLFRAHMGKEIEMDGYAIGSAMARFVILLAVVAFALGALAMWGLPKLWELVKPFIHAMTT